MDKVLCLFSRGRAKVLKKRNTAPLAFICEVDGRPSETDDMLAGRYRLSLHCALEGQSSSDDTSSYQG